MAYVIGIDMGGTFTDAFAADESGRVAAAKTPSTPPDFSGGFLAVLDELAVTLGTETRELLAGTSSTSCTGPPRPSTRWLPATWPPSA